MEISFCTGVAVAFVPYVRKPEKFACDSELDQVGKAWIDAAATNDALGACCRFLVVLSVESKRWEDEPLLALLSPFLGKECIHMQLNLIDLIVNSILRR